MALSQQCRDWAYLLVVGTQLFGMLVLDFVAFYPKFLWQAPSAPLHFLVTLRETYINYSGDPFFSASQHEPWFEAFVYIEIAAQFPLAVYLAYKLASARSTSGATELAALAFGCLTGMGSVVSCFHLWHLPEDVLGGQQKMMLLYGTYLPFAVIPALMALDMHQRLLSRIASIEAKAKKQ
ncbi:hypothetical protein ACRE_038720 [Hapsidospora chrysogenum ATCC 11550]|uniref:EXPERA domain-containing protein n=1 Tax=Hapsidospora chrysogenum (strain ATCC 11550 / CBS 779.69 / DSM 880 / IAM 14645 / JCM 23072 / IMI 49137) TaxID=857340 RepID=A0A086T7I6_HAPC1|nr:hypothetical protein ACRE_038720 [Hapsidospora chrysogenum ATCC 11550]